QPLRTTGLSAAHVRSLLARPSVTGGIGDAVTTVAAASTRSGPLSEALRARLGRQVEHWRDELVDLSKRNRLLYFRPTRVSTLAIQEPGLRDVYARTLAANYSWGLFLP